MPYKDPEKRREYNITYLRKYYIKNKSKLIKKNNERRQKLREEKKKWVVNELGGSCQKLGCGYNKCIWALDIHHILKGMKEDIERRLVEKSWKFIKEYIKKNRKHLVLLCSNCHREEHYKRFKYKDDH